MKRKSLILSALTLFVVVVVTVLIRMFTLDTEIELVQTIDLPELSVVTDMKTGDFRSKAIAVDGKIIQGTNREAQPTASTAKMILGLAIMEKYPFDPGESGQTIEITLEFYNKYLWYVSHNGSNTAVSLGEKISEYDALASVFLASSNNMADTLAIWAFGNLENYRTYATEILRKLGLENTHIGEDACGYSETTTSTAEDLAVIASELLKNPVLREIVSLKSHAVPVAGTLINTNKILGDSLNGGSLITGVKTGHIGAVSGYNLISSYEVENHTITMALLGASTRTASFEESKDELLRLSSEIAPVTIVAKDQPVGYFRTWWNGEHQIYATEEIRTIAFSSPENSLTLSGQSVKAILNEKEYETEVVYDDFSREPTFIERFLHIFGWESR